LKGHGQKKTKLRIKIRERDCANPNNVRGKEEEGSRRGRGGIVIEGMPRQLKRRGMGKILQKPEVLKATSSIYNVEKIGRF